MDFSWVTRFLVLEHKGQRPDREAKVYHITDIEDNHEVHLFENDELCRDAYLLQVKSCMG